MGAIARDAYPVSVMLVDVTDAAQTRLIPKKTVNRERVLITNTYPMTVGATPVPILAHAPKRSKAHLVINGSGIVVFGTSQSDCQDAQSAAVNEYIGAVAYINAAELTTAMDISGTTELWAALVSATDPNAAIVTPVVPATGVVAQNINNYPVTVVIGANGATITNVSVNGVTVGTGAGTYIVPSAGSISIAYTVATPTWSWATALFTIPTTISVIKEIET